MVEGWAATLLLAFSTWIGVAATPASNPTWKVVQDWEIVEGRRQFVGESDKITDGCRTNPSKVVEFPMVIHGAHRITADNGFVKKFGDMTFKKAHPFYQVPVVNCEDLITATTVKWELAGYSSYFSRFDSWPELRKGKSLSGFFGFSANMMTAGGLLVLALFSLVVFQKKVALQDLLSVTLGSAFLSIYYLMVTAPDLGFDLSMLGAHKVADFGLWVGVLFLTFGLWTEKALPDWGFYALTATTALALGFILFGQNGDTIQMGTNVPFPIFMVGMTVGLVVMIKEAISSERDTGRLLKIVGIGFFVLAGNNDIFVITGIASGYLLSSIGALGAFSALALGVHEGIRETYRERDQLLHTLEQKVEEKTAHLVTALHEKEIAQAEAIQSAKMASLGTMAAGLAHEINNSINFVSGSVKPLERLVKNDPNMAKNTKVLKLLDVMKDGLRLTIDIIDSLRTYTGLNSAKVKDGTIAGAVDSVTRILGNKLRGKHSVQVNIAGDIKVQTYLVGVNQILMNLITNAVDAMPEGGKVKVSATEESGEVVLSVADTGSGMDERTASQVFDPFFTTKGVGEGTGLGLFIVKKEVDRLGGAIEVQSSSQGTEVTVKFPAHLPENQLKEVA